MEKKERNSPPLKTPTLPSSMPSPRSQSPKPYTYQRVPSREPTETLEPFSATNNKNEVPDAKSKDLEDKVRQMAYNVLGVDNSYASRPDQYHEIQKRSNKLDLTRFNSD